MMNQRMNGYSPDYNMRRRNAECGCGNAESRSSQGRGAYGAGRCPGREPSPRREMPCANENLQEGAYPVGMAYVPIQLWRELYCPEEALEAGTIFEELDYPWMVGRCARR